METLFWVERDLRSSFWVILIRKMGEGINEGIFFITKLIEVEISNKEQQSKISSFYLLKITFYEKEIFKYFIGHFDMLLQKIHDRRKIPSENIKRTSLWHFMTGRKFFIWHPQLCLSEKISLPKNLHKGFC